MESKLIENLFRKRPLIIAGPCGAETYEQVMDTASAIAEIKQVDIFRAGIWKPRSRAGNFEGVGLKGLPWLKEVKEKFGMPVTTEVATPEQAEFALQYGIDIFWIGARTVVNPFSVQEIADTLKGTDIPLLIKNPIIPDVELWTGAVERFLKAGITKIGLIHRGFSSYANTEYRYAPMWPLAIEMKRRYLDFPMICDATHICGRREIIQDIAQRAMDLDYNGLMIESHRNPDEAWSDAKQQITPLQLKEMLEKIIWRKESSSFADFNIALEKLREQIDQIDDELLQLLGQRMKIADKIGEVKKENNITILQPQRWNQILQRGRAKGVLFGLSDEFILRYLDAVHMESINHQNKVMNKE